MKHIIRCTDDALLRQAADFSKMFHASDPLSKQLDGVRLHHNLTFLQKHESGLLIFFAGMRNSDTLETEPGIE